MDEFQYREARALRRIDRAALDSRGVFRVYETRVADEAWQWWRDAAGFSQRFTGQCADGGDTIVGRSQLCRDDVHWADDLAITYRRQPGP